MKSTIEGISYLLILVGIIGIIAIAKQSYPQLMKIIWS